MLKTAVKKLEKLFEDAAENDTYPITTQKALTATMQVFSDTQIRVITGNAKIV